MLRLSPSPELRYRALTVLMSDGSPDEALEASRRSLGDAEAMVKALAVKQLGVLKQSGRVAATHPDWPAIAGELSAFLDAEDGDTRFEAARALGRIDPAQPSARDVLLKLLDAEETQPLMLAMIVAALGERNDIAPSQLAARFRELISHDRAEVRENITAAVAGWGPQAALLIEELIVAADDEEPVVRENAALALGRTQVASEAVLAALATASFDEDPGVAAIAAAALQQLQGTRNTT